MYRLIEDSWLRFDVFRYLAAGLYYDTRLSCRFFFDHLWVLPCPLRVEGLQSFLGGRMRFGPSKCS